MANGHSLGGGEKIQLSPRGLLFDRVNWRNCHFSITLSGLWCLVQKSQLGPTSFATIPDRVKKHGWDYTAITGVKEYSANAATLAAGITLGLATGIMLVPTGQNIVHDIASNLVAKNNLLYFASRESIACIDLKGNVVWQTSLPRKLTSKSTLIVENDVVYLINRGFAYQNNRLMEFGKPFIASFNLINGQQSYMHRNHRNALEEKTQCPPLTDL